MRRPATGHRASKAPTMYEIHTQLKLSHHLRSSAIEGNIRTPGQDLNLISPETVHSPGI
jgi:hypothetical protein